MSDQVRSHARTFLDAALAYMDGHAYPAGAVETLNYVRDCCQKARAALTPLAPEVPPRPDGLREALTPLQIEAINANAGLPGTMTAYEASEAIRGILEHGLRYIPGATEKEERRFNDGYALGLYRAQDILARLAATRTPEPPDSEPGTVAPWTGEYLPGAAPPDSGDRAAPDCDAVKSALARLVLHPAPTIGSRSFRVALAEGLRLLGYEAADPDEYTPAADAGIDVALLRAAIIEVLDPNDPPATNINVLLGNTAELVREYARLRSGSPAPEGGE